MKETKQSLKADKESLKEDIQVLEEGNAVLLQQIEALETWLLEQERKKIYEAKKAIRLDSREYKDLKSLIGELVMKKGDTILIGNEVFHIFHTFQFIKSYCIIIDRNQNTYPVPIILIEEFLKLQEKVENLEKPEYYDDMYKPAK